jgi:hypothetical protein
MHFLVDSKMKVIIGWSAKCGCTHIKILFQYFTNTRAKRYLHDPAYLNTVLPTNLDDYTILIILRNPYERLVSGFLDKYQIKGSYFFGELTFRSFVHELTTTNFSRINGHHFTPQLSEKWSDIKSHRNFIVNDLKNINYSLLENIYKKKIPKSILNHQGPHTTHNKPIVDYPVYDIIQTEYFGKKPLLHNFFDYSIKDQVDNFYKDDFEFAAKYNIFYELC